MPISSRVKAESPPPKSSRAEKTIRLPVTVPVPNWVVFPPGSPVFTDSTLVSIAPEMVTWACAPNAVMASMAAAAREMLELFIVFSYGFCGLASVKV
jgi:hypothetical protein